MAQLLTAAQMRAMEQAAIDSGAVTGLELMERAGAGVVEAVMEEWPELAQGTHRALVLCGPGNNGGDGFVVARLLKERGWTVEVFLYGNPEKLPPDAKANFERWQALGPTSDMLDMDAASSVALDPSEDGILLDAIFGTGLSRGLEADLRLALSSFRSVVPVCFLKSVNVDVPSGLCSDSGKWLVGEDGFDTAWRTDLTVTFHRPRVAHYLSDAQAQSLRVKDIGLDAIQNQRHASSIAPGLTALLSDAASRTDPLEMESPGFGAKDMLDAVAPQPAITELLQGCVGLIDKAETGGHKYTHGHALVLSGGFGQTGAARLAARGALRIGAGLVTLAVPGSAQMEVACQITGLMMRRVEDAAELTEVLSDARLNALCLGPGLGLERARDVVPAALAFERPTVLDADALSAFSDNPEMLFANLHGACVMTPHMGEFARLFPDIAQKLNAPAKTGPAYSKVDATRDAAARAGCVVLLKGPDTVIAAPDGRTAINAALYERQAPWLATAGSGDVLAGFITGLLARGFEPMQAAETAAWLHVECGRSFGPGLIAEDLPEILPKVLQSRMG